MGAKISHVGKNMFQWFSGSTYGLWHVECKVSHFQAIKPQLGCAPMYLAQMISRTTTWVTYNISLTWIKAIWGWFPLLTMISSEGGQWGRYNLPRHFEEVASIDVLKIHQLLQSSTFLIGWKRLNPSLFLDSWTQPSSLAQPFFGVCTLLQ